MIKKILFIPFMFIAVGCSISPNENLAGGKDTVEVYDSVVWPQPSEPTWKDRYTDDIPFEDDTLPRPLEREIIDTTEDGKVMYRYVNGYDTSEIYWRYEDIH